MTSVKHPGAGLSGRPRLWAGLWLLLALALAGCRASAAPIATTTITADPVAATLPPPLVATGSRPAPTQQAAPSAVPLDTLPSQTPAPTEIPPVGRQVLGYSTQDRPVDGWRIGRGPFKAVIVGGEAAGEELAAFFQSRPERVPEQITLWFIPSLNPDNPGQNGNGRGVDLMRNADTVLDGCPGNDWRAGGDPPPGGAYPFSEVESRLWQSFLADAWLVIWHGEGLQAGGCGLEQPSQELAAVLAGAAGLALAGEPLAAGHPVDYLAGWGTAAVTMPLSGGLAQTAAGIEAALAEASAIMAGGPAPVYWLDTASSGRWHFPAGSFPHPLALTVAGGQLYIIDSGRVLQIDLDRPAVPQVLLAGGNDIDGVRVLEPLDLAVDGQGLLVLDRAGDIYRFDLAARQWQVERYDRPVGATSAHYYVALANSGGIRQLLETDYHLAILFPAGGSDFAWRLPEIHQVDISSAGRWSYVLASETRPPLGRLSRYDSAAGSLDDDFEAQTGLLRPRQLEATELSVMVLDQAGRRLVALDPESGRLQATYRLTDGQAAGAFTVDPAGRQLIVAGADTLYWWGQPEKQAIIAGPGPTTAAVVHRPEILESLRGLLMPIGGTDLTRRDNQLPGAPRHYRLGIHEGLDLYWTTGTAVRATASGTVIRADWDYANPSPAQFGSWGSLVDSLGYTSPEAQEFYRGRQVWLAHDGGLISRYVHLSGIGPGIAAGATVSPGQVVGYVGNSGSPVSLESDTADAHLHFELWLGDHYLGQFLRPIELREWLAILLR